MKFIKVNSPTLIRILANPAFKKRISQPVKLNYQFDIPYLCGYSKNGKVVYVDRLLKTQWKYQGKTIDVVDFLVVHEVVEKALIDLFKLHYQKAHHIAEHVESMACNQYGVNWWAYSKFLKPQIKTAYHDKIKKIPRDLDLTPYEDEHEKKILMELQRRKINRSVKESLTNQTDLDSIQKGTIDGIFRNLYERGLPSLRDSEELVKGKATVFHGVRDWHGRFTRGSIIKVPER